ncbi:MAG: hypothetical protein M3R46_15485, partial [Actinomycetota bacterium]|nr:hypothetical protein [Actinomycetota bacterium]
MNTQQPAGATVVRVAQNPRNFQDSDQEPRFRGSAGHYGLRTSRSDPLKRPETPKWLIMKDTGGRYGRSPRWSRT